MHRHITGLDGLRALACLAVFGVHFQQITGAQGSVGSLDVKRFLENGNTGVALFFALSGFLLSLPFWSGHLAASEHAWLGRFVRRRLVRIVPAYYLCLTVLVIHQRHWQDAFERRDTLAHYLFLQNYGQHFFYSICPPFWTVAVQAQFYVVLALLFWILGKTTGNNRSGFIVIACASIVAYVAHWQLMEHGDRLGASLGFEELVSSRPTVFSHSVLAHLPHLLWGVLAGGIYLHFSAGDVSERMRWAAEILFWCGLVTILVILSTPLDDALQIPFGRYNLPYVPAAISMLIVLSPFTRIASRALDWAPLRLLGQISFGVYVFHLPCMRLVERTMSRNGFAASDHWLAFAAASFALSIGVATLSYYVFERKCLQLGASSRHAAERG